MAYTTAAVALALIIGIGVGLTLDAFRGRGLGGPPAFVLDAADLQGTWLSDEILFQEWVDALLERGFTTDEIAAFLEHDPFDRSVQYELSFGKGEATIRARYDDEPFVALSSESFSILDGGRIRIGDEVSECRLTVGVALDGGRLTFSRPVVPGCPVDERIAGVSFFELTGYDRQEE